LKFILFVKSLLAGLESVYGLRKLLFAISVIGGVVYAEASEMNFRMFLKNLAGHVA